MSASLYTALARLIRAFCPPLREAPLSPIIKLVKYQLNNFILIYVTNNCQVAIRKLLEIFF